MQTARKTFTMICLTAYTLALLSGIWAGSLVVASGPLVAAFAGTVMATLVIFACARILNNSSLYDPYWSLQPIVLGAWWMIAGPGVTALSGVLFFLVALWGVRLTYNCMRRFSSLDYEDPRYIDIRAKTGILWPLVDLLGIQMMPTVLVFAGSMPLALVILEPAGIVGPLAALGLIVTVGAILIEAIADAQLRRFQATNTDPAKVCTVGLWSRSRHPNYFGEMSFWWGLSLVALDGGMDRAWSGIGALLITLLFLVFSIPDMQRRKAAKRPDYARQVKGIPVLVPRIF